MIDIILDTNIYRKNPKRNNASFRALSFLCENSHLKLHIPFIVEQEFLSQVLANYETPLKSIESSINSLIKKDLPSTEAKLLTTINSQINSANETISDWLKEEFSNWTNSISANRVPLSPNYAERVFNAYFKGLPPFKEKKVRKDLPDSFIYESIQDISSVSNNIALIIEDGALRESFQSRNNIKAFKSLEEFIEQASIQELLKEHKVAETFTDIISSIHEYIGDIECAIESEFIDTIAWQQFTGEDVLDDNNEATISGVGSMDDFTAFFEKASYYGQGIIGIPFECTSEVLAFSYLFKSELYSLDDERIKSISFSDHNDHYFEVEEYFTVKIYGRLKIEIDVERFDPNGDISDFIEFDNATIDSIEEIEQI